MVAPDQKFYILLQSNIQKMNVSILQRRLGETIEDSIEGVEAVLKEFGLTSSMTLLRGEYREVIYETPSNGGIKVQYRLDDALEIPIHVESSDGDTIPSVEFPHTFHADNVLYSIGMDHTLYDLIGKNLSKYFDSDIINIKIDSGSNLTIKVDPDTE
tara:strand:+ start:323 stop:793 length:471 start_codon:yes stop_codon:yes gene_type:complete